VTVLGIILAGAKVFAESHLKNLLENFKKKVAVNIA
jgi:hypothetical protein